MTRRLSKSRFLDGLQCHKLLWWQVHEPDARASFRFSFARCQVTVREHLNGAISIWYGPRRIGRYDGTGTAAKGAPRVKTREVA